MILAPPIWVYGFTLKIPSHGYFLGYILIQCSLRFEMSSTQQNMFSAWHMISRSMILQYTHLQIYIYNVYYVYVTYCIYESFQFIYYINIYTPMFHTNLFRTNLGQSIHAARFPAIQKILKTTRRKRSRFDRNDQPKQKPKRVWPVNLSPPRVWLLISHLPPLQGTNISHPKGTFEGDFSFSQSGIW